LILESQGQHIAPKRKEFTALALAGSIMKKYIYLIKKAIMILISLVQELTQPKCIQWALKAKDMEFIQEQGMLKVKIKLNVIKFSIDPVLIQMKQNVPGPGTYGQGIEINKYGSYILSTIENTKAATWSNSKNRFIDEQKHSKEIPGPGKYDPSDYNGSQYVLSAYRSYGTRKYRKDSNVSKK